MTRLIALAALLLAACAPGLPPGADGAEPPYRTCTMPLDATAMDCDGAGVLHE